MALFIGERRMAPADFWALTLPEIQAVLGPPAPGGTRRGDLARLMERFPDA
ncbi:phage tail assembly chaperone [Acuticoccus sediminis]|uniref:Phage tail assembly chaperone n=2 Tax=Acuticoccus sediminis TaxID=2184697 RepID=A0A8B2NI91_9HYPH|nr:phage tail assembly chaperone [Acuticoccus sediminis]